MKKIFCREVSPRVFTIVTSVCLMGVAFIFACGFGDETAPLMYNPISKACSTAVNFTGDMKIAGESIVGTTGSAYITTLGTVDTGVWHGTAIPVAYGGTGSTSAANARTALGVAPAAGSASITTLGTVDTGVWHGTAVAVGYGGTGAATAAAARTALGCVSVYTGAAAALPVTTGKVKGDLYVTDEGAAWICVSIGADTTGWKQISN